MCKYLHVFFPMYMRMRYMQKVFKEIVMCRYEFSFLFDSQNPRPLAKDPNAYALK